MMVAPPTMGHNTSGSAAAPLVKDEAPPWQRRAPPSRASRHERASRPLRRAPSRPLRRTTAFSSMLRRVHAFAAVRERVQAINIHGAEVL